MQFGRTPTSIRDIALRVTLDGADYATTMKEFIDHLIGELRGAGVRLPMTIIPISPSMFTDAPPEMANPLQRVYLAGMAEHLAHISGQEPPAWCQRPDYFLKEPIFFGGREARERSMQETPAAWRRRLLFCGQTLTKMTTSLRA